MRLQATILAIPLLVLVGCELSDDVSARNAPHEDCDAGADEAHPYTTCAPDQDDPGAGHEIHPACTLGCGHLGVDEQGSGHMVCGIPCEADADCSPYEGDGNPLTRCEAGRCYYFCDDSHACPSDLECVDRGDPIPGDTNPAGECQAPYQEP